MAGLPVPAGRRRNRRRRLMLNPDAAVTVTNMMPQASAAVLEWLASLSLPDAAATAAN